MGFYRCHWQPIAVMIYIDLLRSKLLQIMFNNNSAQIVNQTYNTSSLGSNIFRNTNMQSSNNIFQNNTQSNSNQPQTSNYVVQNNTQSHPNNYIQQNTNQMKSTHNYIQEQELFKTFTRIVELARSDETIKLIAIVEKTFEHTDGILKRACREGESITKENKKDLRDDIKNKYAQIKERNNSILKSMMNLRQKMINQMFMYKVRAPAKENELQSITQKIAAISNDIKAKLTKYKFAKKMNCHAQKKVVKSVPINTPLIELRSASEKLSKETIRLKEELKMCVTVLNNRDI